VELVHHGVDGVFQFEDFALHVHGDLARQITARHRGRHFGNVAHLRGQVTGHRVDVVGEVFPGASHTRHVGLPTQPPLRADFTRHARPLPCELVELVHHGVERFLQLQDFTTHVDGDLTGQVTSGDGRGHLGDVAHLPGQVAGHEVDVVGEV